MWDVNYALYGLAAKLCDQLFLQAMQVAALYKTFKAVENLHIDEYTSGMNGTPEGIWESSGTLTGWAEYGYDYPHGAYPRTQDAYQGCIRNPREEKGNVTIRKWPW